MGLDSFPARVEDATKAVGAENILAPAACKEFMEANKDALLLLDVQDPGSDSIPGAYNASLGTLVFKADAGMTDFKDPKIADLPKDNPIVVTCAIGGQALLGAKVMVDYGFKNVKVMEGGCVAFKKL
jgi:rhodanese-related sulfurtransferase